MAACVRYYLCKWLCVSCLTQVSFEPELVPDAEGKDSFVVLFLGVAQLLFDPVWQVVPAGLGPDVRLHAGLVHGGGGGVEVVRPPVRSIPYLSRLFSGEHLFLFLLYLRIESCYE